jgi:hypothetical protein
MEKKPNIFSEYYKKYKNYFPADLYAMVSIILLLVLYLIFFA